MKRIAASIVLWLWSCLAFAGWFPLAGAGAPTFFFASAGSDSNLCTQASPCQTVTKANTMAAGSTVKFNGGDSFSTTTGITADVSVASYGTGQGTISSGNSAPCVKITNPAASRTVTGITCTGGGVASNNTAGISFINSQAGNTKLVGPTISNVTVSGYGGNGIEIKGTNGSSGFTNFSITNNTVSNSTGNGGNSSSCINVFGASYGSGTTTPAHTNVTISGNTVSNCTGQASQTGWTGSGIVVAETQFATVQNNVAHDFGVNSGTCGGPVGIWTYDSDSITIQFNEAYNGETNSGAGGCDGGGFDIDGGVTNSVLQFNYAHNNASNCILFTSYNDGQVTTWANNTARYNICQNNLSEEISLAALTGSTMTNPMVYNNSLGCGITGICFDTSGVGAIVGPKAFLANNILYGKNADNIISVPNVGTLVLTGNDYYCSLLQGCSINYSWNGTTYTSFASWQTATGQEKISGSNVGLTSNPQQYCPNCGLTNGGYVPAALMAYNLQSGSPMIAGGIDVAATYTVNIGTQDYYGASIAAKGVGAAAGDFTTFAGSCTAATNFAARMTSPAKQDEVIANYILCGLNATGDLANLDFYHYFAFASQTNALLNLVSSNYNDVTGNSPTFTAGQGFTGNGSNAYVAPASFVPFTQFTLNSAMGCVYDLTSRTSGAGNNAMGASSSGSAYFGVWALTGSNAFYEINGTVGFAVSTVTNSQGLSAILRSSSSTSAFYKNGGIQDNPSDTSSAIPASIVTTLAFNSATAQPTITPGQGTTDTIAADCVGNGSVSMTNLSTVTNTAAMAKGQNVY